MRRGLALLAIAGCAAGELATPRAAPETTPLPFAIAGESMEFVAELRGIRVARVVIAVGDAGYVDGRRAIIVRSRGHSDGLLTFVSELTWELTTTLELAGGLPISGREELWSKFRGRSDHDRWSIDEDERDAHAAIGALRAWRAPRGKRVEMDVTIAGADVSLVLWEAGRGERIGKFPAVRFAGIAREKYNVSAWISDDADRVPLLFRAETKWGDVTVRLVEYGAAPGREP